MSDPNRSNEMFYEEGGKRRDSDLHEELFEDGAEEEASKAMLEEMLDDGMDPEIAHVLYGRNFRTRPAIDP